MLQDFTRGRGRYLDDVKASGCRAVAFVRSPHAHARVTGFDVPAGVRARAVKIVTGAELRDKIRPLRVDGPGLRGYDWYALSPAKALFVGEPVAAVVGRNAYEAEDLAGEIEVEYDVLQPVTSCDQAEMAEAVLHAEVPDNILFRRVFNEGATAAAFAEADVVIERTFQHPRQTAVPLEGRGVMARYDAAEGRFTIWVSTQLPNILRTGIAAVLGVPESAIRIIRPDVGGAFGLKTQILTEEIVVPWLARELGAPVK